MSWINDTEVSPGVFVVRFLDQPTSEPFAPFGGVCTAVFGGRDVVTLHAMYGRVRRYHLKALCDWVIGRGARIAMAHRADGHRLPGAVEDMNGWLRIDVPLLGQRL